MIFDCLVLALYVAGMVFIALYTRKKAKTADDFLLAGKKGLNGWMSAFAYGTTYFSAVIFIGYAGKFGLSFGLAAIWIGVGNAILGSLVAWKLLAKRTKNMTRRMNAKTMPQFFEYRYGSRGLKLMAAIIVFLFLIPYGASVYNGLGALFEAVFNVDAWVVIVVMAAVTTLYLVFGGYLATSLSDFVQGLIMLVGVVIMVIFFLNSPQVNWSEGLDRLIATGYDFFPETAEGVDWIYGSGAMLISLVLLTSVGVYGLPQTIHKYYTVRDAKAIKQGTIVSTLFALIVGVGAYFVGALGSLFLNSGALPDGTNAGNIIPRMLDLVIPAGVMGLIAVLVLSASMSTLASVSLSSSSVASIDVYKGFINKNADDKRVTLAMRIVCFAFVIISVVLALLNNKYNITAISSLMAISWGTLSGCFIGPYVISLFSKKVTKTASYVSMIGSLVLTVVLTIAFGYGASASGVGFGAALKRGFDFAPMVGVLCMAYSLIITPVVSLFTKKPSDEIIQNCFEKQVEGVIE